MNNIKKIPLYIMLFFSIIATLIIIFLKYYDGDVYHLLYTGREIYNNGINNTNPFFIENNFQIIYQQWLYALIMYCSYLRLGDIGIYLFTVCNALILYLSIFIFLRTHKIKKWYACFYSFLILNTMAYLNCRPQMISVALILFTLTFLNKYKETDNIKWLFSLPIIILLEMNLHSTFWVFHFAFSLIYIVPFNKILNIKNINSKIIDDVFNRKQLKIIGIFFLISFVFLFINPYFLNGIIILLNSDVSKVPINEMKRLNIISVENTIFLILSIVLIYLYKKRRLKSNTLYMYIGIYLITIIGIRNVMFIPIVLSYIIKDLHNEHKLNEIINKINENKIGIKIVLIILYFVIFFGVLQSYDITYTKIDGKEENIYRPYGAYQYISNEEKDISNIKIFTTFNTGSYFIWKGCNNVYIDAKAEPYNININKQKDILYEYWYIRNYATADEIKDFLDYYDFDYILESPSECSYLYTYVQMSDEYELVYESDDIIYDNTKELVSSNLDFYNTSIPRFRLYKHIR